MRTNIEIDDTLMADALEITGIATKREVVDLALRTLVRMEAQHSLRALRGKVAWEGDLEKMRLD